MEINEAINFINEHLDTQEVKDFFQPHLDRHFSKSLETWKKNTLPDIIKQSAAEPETPEQIKLKELTAEIEKIKAEKDRAEFESEMISYASTKGLPATIAKALTIHGNPEQSRLHLDELAGQIRATIETERIKNASGATPKAGGITPSNFNLETISDMSTNEIYSNLDNLTKG